MNERNKKKMNMKEREGQINETKIKIMKKGKQNVGMKEWVGELMKQRNK